MARSRLLRQAPITEAIIDFRVELAENFDPRRFLSLKPALSEGYSDVGEMTRFEGGLQFEAERVSPFAREKGLRGYMFRSADRLNVAQFRRDGFTFSRLSPYTSWEQVFPEAFRLWQLYVRDASPELVSRVAVRYINRLRLPLPIPDFSQYLTAPPSVPPELRHPITAFLSRVLLHETQSGLDASVTQAFERGVDPAYIAVLLDIDSFNVEPRKTDDENIRATFEALRNLKNSIFFSSITEEAARLFE